MENPFLVAEPQFGTETQMKAGLNNDGLLTDAGNEPLTENPFLADPAAQREQVLTKNPFIQEDTFDPKAFSDEMAQFGARQAIGVTQAAAQPKPGKLREAYESYKANVAKPVTQGLGEGVALTGSMGSMIATYLNYAGARLNGMDPEQASAMAKQERDKFAEYAQEGLPMLVEAMGIDRSWVENPKFKKFLQEADEKAFAPARDKYFPAQDSLAGMLFEDISYLAPFGVPKVGKIIKKNTFDDHVMTGPQPKPAEVNVAAENLKSRVDVGVDTSKMKNPFLVGARDELGMPDEQITSATSATGEPGWGQMDNIQRKPIPPYWVDPELSGAMKDANTEANKSGSFPIDYEGPGKGQDVDASNIRSPYMSAGEVASAERLGEPAAWEHKPLEMTTDRVGEQFITKDESIEPIQEGKVQKSGFATSDDLWQKEQFVNDVRNAENVKDAVTAVGEHTTDPLYKRLATVLNKSLEKIKFTTRDERIQEGSAGESVIYVDGHRLVRVRDTFHALKNKLSNGMDAETILHEAGHAATSAAMEIADHPILSKQAKYQNHVNFAKEVKRLLKFLNPVEYRNQPHIWKERLHENQAVRERVGRDLDLIRYATQDPHEFVTMAWSNKRLRDIMSDIKIPDSNQSLWSRFVNSTKRLLGIDKDAGMSTLLDKMMGLQDQLPYIQGVEKADLGKAIDGWAGEADSHAMPSNWATSVRKDINPDWSAAEAVVENEGKDLHVLVPQNLITPNQIAPLAHNTVMGWFIAKAGQIGRQAAPRFMMYKQALEPFMFDKKTKLERGQQIKTFKALVDLQDPALKDARAHAENNGTREALLEAHGLAGRELEFAITVLDIMKDVHKRDIESTTRLGRPLDYQPMYFPRIHGGRFIVKVRDANGVEQFVKGFEKYGQAREAEAHLTNSLRNRPDLSVERVERAERNTFGDDFAQILLEGQVDFSFLDKGLKAIEKGRETAQFSFEKGRRDENVGGYVGEDITSKAEQERLLQVMSWRLLASRNLETKSRLLSEVKFPLFDNPWMLDQTPRLRLALGQLINRELGVDITTQKRSLDLIEQGLVESGTKLAAALVHFEEKYIRGKRDWDFRWSDPMAAHDAARDMARVWTWTTSMLKLSWNLPVLATNAAQPTLIGLDGIRTASLEGVNPGHAWTAMIRSLSYWGKDPETRAFMKQAATEGMFDPHSHEHYTTAELPDRNVVDKALQYPRDKVEQATNYASILYYYNFFKSARPELLKESPEAFKAKVYEYTRSFTGQYDSVATPMMFDKAGTTGQLFTNFSKWHFNQLGRLLVDARNAGVDHSAVPILMTGMMTMLSAGLYGLPVVVEYEALRRLGSFLGIWDLPPISGLRAKVGNSIPAWEWFERGAFTGLSNALGEVLGANTGPDLSGSMRYSAFFDAPTVAIQNFWDVFGRFVPFLTKEVGVKFGYGRGNSPQEIEDAMKGVPPVLKEGFRAAVDSRHGSMFKQKMTVNGKTVYSVKDPSTGEKLYSLSEMEDLYNTLGMKGTRENKQLEAIYWTKWLERQDEKRIKELRGGMLGNMFDKDTFRRDLREMIDVGGKKAVDETFQQIKGRLSNGQKDFFIREYQKLQHETDGVQKNRKNETIQQGKGMSELREGPMSESELLSEDVGTGLAKISRPKNDYKPANKTELDYAIPNLRVREFDQDSTLAGFMREKDQNDMIFVNKQSTNQDFAVQHEGEHILQKKGLGRTAGVNAKFDELVGDTGTTRHEVVKALVQPDVRAHLKEKWGITDAYFDPEMYKFQGSVARNLLYEQFASLAAAEHMKGVAADITKDPMLREKVFDTAAKREAFRAVTGLRQTRLDAKDLSPYTRVTEKPEPTKPDEGTIKKWLRSLGG